MGYWFGILLLAAAATGRPMRLHGFGSASAWTLDGHEVLRDAGGRACAAAATCRLARADLPAAARACYPWPSASLLRRWTTSYRRRTAPSATTVVHASANGHG